MEPLGIYLHIPFCVSKCAYCDFYSLSGTDNLYDEYEAALCKRIKLYGERLSKPCDTIYFGGGTPTVLGAERLVHILKTVKESFEIAENAEITLEANAGDNLDGLLQKVAASGVNRLSLGVQSSNSEELKRLGRRHTNQDIINAVLSAHKHGITNISCDLMLGIPEQTMDSLEESISFLLSLPITHISVYILTIEKDTPFGKVPTAALNLPDEDILCDMYLFACDMLRKSGFSHYEISNFAKNGAVSRHNTKYWTLADYVGIGPAAHSFIDGKRFFYKRDVKEFLNTDKPCSDGFGGDESEYIMLHLRLNDGIVYQDFKERYHVPFPLKAIETAKKYEPSGMVEISENGFSLSEKGFLVSNSIISDILAF